MSIFGGKGKVVVALGGGGSRGLAHLGVLQVLEEADIPIAGIVGTSVGAIVGAAYSLRPEAKPITRMALEYLRSDRFRNNSFRRLMFGSNDVEQNFVRSVLTGIRTSLSFSSLIRRPAIFDGVQLREVVDELVPNASFSDARLPFAVPAIDLRQPMEVLLTSGSLRDAVVASCSLPGFFPPVEIDGMLLADIGVIGSVPVEAARALVPGALVLAVDISTELEPMKDMGRGWDAILRVEAIATKKLNELELDQADVVLRPQVGAKYWSDFSELQRLVDAGAKEAMGKVGEIRARLHRWLDFLRR